MFIASCSLLPLVGAPAVPVCGWDAGACAAAGAHLSRSPPPATPSPPPQKNPTSRDDSKEAGRLLSCGSPQNTNTSLHSKPLLTHRSPTRPTNAPQGRLQGGGAPQAGRFHQEDRGLVEREEPPGGCDMRRDYTLHQDCPCRQLHGTAAAWHPTARICTRVVELVGVVAQAGAAAGGAQLRLTLVNTFLGISLLSPESIKSLEPCPRPPNACAPRAPSLCTTLSLGVPLLPPSPSSATPIANSQTLTTTNPTPPHTSAGPQVCVP